MSAKTLRYLIVIGLIALWELLPRTGLIPELFLPSLSSTPDGPMLPNTVMRSR